MAFNHGRWRDRHQVHPDQSSPSRRVAIGHGHRPGARADQYNRRDQPALHGDQLRRSVPMRSARPPGPPARHPSRAGRSSKRWKPESCCRPCRRGSGSPIVPALPPRTVRRSSAPIPDSPNGLHREECPGTFLNPTVLSRWPTRSIRRARRPGRRPPRDPSPDIHGAVGSASTRSARLGSRIGPARSTCTATRAARTSSSRGSSRSRSSRRPTPAPRRHPATPTPTRSRAWPTCSPRTISSRAAGWCSTSTARRPRAPTRTPCRPN